jgi:hypothetical protein
MTGLQLRLRAAYAQRLLRALTGGTLGTLRGYSGYTRQAVPPDDGAGPTPLTAQTRRAYPCAPDGARRSAHAHAHANVCVRRMARPTHILLIYYHNKRMATAFLRMPVATRTPSVHVRVVFARVRVVHCKCRCVFACARTCVRVGVRAPACVFSL